MERKQFIGFLLIGLIVSGYMMWNTMQTVPPQKAKPSATDPVKKSSAATAATQAEQRSSQTSTTATNVQQMPSADGKLHTKYGSLYHSHLSGREEIITIENDLIQARISSRGGTVRAWRLRHFRAWFGDTVQLVPFSNQFGELGITFRDMNDGQGGTTRESNIVDTRELYFSLKTPPLKGSTVKVTGDDSVQIVASLALDNGGVIEKTYTFYGNKYSTNLALRVSGMGGVMDSKYSLHWNNGLQYQEKNSVDESLQAKAWLAQNGTIAETDAGGEAKPVSASGALDFAAMKSKYFMAAVIPSTTLKGDLQTSLTGYKVPTPDEGSLEKYTMRIDVPYSQNRTDNFTVYVGPVEYDILKQYGLQSGFNFATQSFLGLQYISGPIGEYVILPILSFIHKYVISNYGLAIILFSIVMKLLLHPLSITQMQTQQKMQLLAPELEKIRAKHKDDAQEQQKETMKLYGEYGISPAGGCLPLLLQMPILTALYSVFQSEIQLRQTSFFGWITDLSMPDELLRLPFKVPLVNVDIISGLALAMGLTMFVQQYTTVKDPQQRAMVYMMPVMFTFMFANLPAGLTLYYFMFNVWSIAQQEWTKRFSKNKMTLADLKKMPKKEGWLQKRLREAQEVAGGGQVNGGGGRTLPGQSPVQGPVQRGTATNNGANGTTKKRK
jgi:YidC/Oxa1 family membrane protein insertase